MHYQGLGVVLQRRGLVFFAAAPRAGRSGRAVHPHCGRKKSMVRDGTLFGLTLLKTFIWVEAVGLLLCFISVPVIYFWGESMRLGWLRQILGSEPWSIQKVLILIVSMVSLGMAALRTTLVFDRKREKLLEEARQQREQAQQARLERVRRQRRLEAQREQKNQKPGANEGGKS